MRKLRDRGTTCSIRRVYREFSALADSIANDVIYNSLDIHHGRLAYVESPVFVRALEPMEIHQRSHWLVKSVEEVSVIAAGADKT